MTTGWNSPPNNPNISLSNANLTATQGANRVVAIAIDFANGKFWVRTPLTTLWNGSVTADPASNVGGIVQGASGAIFPFWTAYGAGGAADTVVANFGASAFSYAIPAGFSSWNALAGATTWDPANKNAGVALSGGNLIASVASGGAYQGVKGTTSLTAGKVYFELTMTSMDNGPFQRLGFGNASASNSGGAGADANSYGYFTYDNTIYHSGSNSGAYGSSWFLSTLHQYGSVVGVTGRSSGLYYFEVTFTTMGSANGGVVGVSDGSITTGGVELGLDAHSYGYNIVGGTFSNNGSTIFSGSVSVANGEVIGVAVNFTTSKIWIWNSRASAWNFGATGTQNPATGAGGIAFSLVGLVYPALSIWTHDVSAVINANFTGSPAFSNPIPSGFSSWEAAPPTAANRVSAFYDEVIAGGSGAKTRISDFYLEVLGPVPGAKARMSNYYLEVLGPPPGLLFARARAMVQV